MKILMLSPTFPIPPHTGGKVRVLQSLTYLSRRHEVSLVCMFDGGEDTPSLTSKLQEYCNEVYLFGNSYSGPRIAFSWMVSSLPYKVIRFWSREAHSFVEHMLKSKDFDLVWCHFISTSVYCKRDSGIPVLLDTHNDDVLDWLTLARNSRSLLKRIIGYVEAWKIARFRRERAPIFDIVLAVSPEEAQRVQEWAHKGTKIWLVPNGVDVDHYRFHAQQKKDRDIVLFCGSMDVTRNVEAVLFFVEEILPIVAKELSDVEFRVVGRNPAWPIVKLQTAEGISVTGTVDDVRPHYIQAKVAVAPFKLGGGTKLKVLEAMAMGVPVVATSVGAQGLDVKDGIHLFIEDEPWSFAQRVLMLLRDESERQRIAWNARALVERRYSWESLFKNLDYRLTEYIESWHGGNRSPR